MSLSIKEIESIELVNQQTNCTLAVSFSLQKEIIEYYQNNHPKNIFYSNYLSERKTRIYLTDGECITCLLHEVGKYIKMKALCYEFV